MTKLLPLAAAALLLPLAACNTNTQPEVVDTRSKDPMAEQLKNAAPVELPPAVAATVTFRCQPGNVLRFVDFFQGNKLANLRVDKAAAPIQLKAEEAGQPYVGGGYTLTGTAKSATLEGVGGKLTCKA